jgi:3-dehydroquinate synthase
MSKITVAFPVNPASDYDITIEPGLLHESVKWLPKNYQYLVIITDDTVCAHYGKSLELQLKRSGHHVLLLTFSPGERSKNAKTKQKLEEKILSHTYGRQDTLILALGGGVTGDLAGFIAATYMRGIPYIQVPTTLLAMIDSSVGGKVGVNTPQGKNLVGAFWQPLAVITDINTLKTLDKKHIIAGLIEAMKMFLTNDNQSFQFLMENVQKILSLDEQLLVDIIYRAVNIKAYVVNKDEKEMGMRRVLNFGHTIGHALEKLSQYRMIHGYAVGYGILVEAKISQLMGLLSEQDYEKIQFCLALLGIHGKILKKYNVEKIIELTHSDKKTKAGQVRYVLLEKIGTVGAFDEDFVYPAPKEIVRAAIIDIQEK